MYTELALFPLAVFGVVMLILTPAMFAAVDAFVARRSRQHADVLAGCHRRIRRLENLAEVQSAHITALAPLAGGAAGHYYSDNTDSESESDE